MLYLVELKIRFFFNKCQMVLYADYDTDTNKVLNVMNILKV